VEHERIPDIMTKPMKLYQFVKLSRLLGVLELFYFVRFVIPSFSQCSLVALVKFI